MNFFTAEAQRHGEEIEVSANEAGPFPGLMEPAREAGENGCSRRAWELTTKTGNRELGTDH